MEDLKPTSVNSSPLTPLGFLERAATVYGDCPSVIYEDTTYTWTQTHRRCLRVASSISSLGIDRQATWCPSLSPNIPAMYELHFAVPMSGAILNNINTRLDARTVSVLLRHSESKLVFVDYELRSLILEAISLFPPNTPSPRLVLIANDSGAPSRAAPLDHFLCTYEDLVDRGDEGFEWVLPSNEWNPMTLNYTSGTTSSPKGVVHSHRGVFIIAVDSLIDWGVPKQPVYLWTLPMFHANGWSYPYGMAAIGGTNICVRKFDAQIIYAMIKRHRVTHMCGAPVVLNMLTNVPSGTEKLEYPVHILTAGAPPPAQVLIPDRVLGFRGESRVWADRNGGAGGVVRVEEEVEFVAGD